MFQEVGVSLFPSRSRHLKTECTCPDWSNPCKHIVAVYYRLGEEFDRDPFQIFKLRGMEREELMELLGGGPSGDEDGSAEPAQVPPATDPGAFWSGPATDKDTVQSEATPVPVRPSEAALARRLGGFPFWRGREDFHEAVDRASARCARGRVEVLGRMG